MGAWPVSTGAVTTLLLPGPLMTRREEKGGGLASAGVAITEDRRQAAGLNNRKLPQSWRLFVQDQGAGRVGAF